MNRKPITQTKLTYISALFDMVVFGVGLLLIEYSLSSFNVVLDYKLFLYINYIGLAATYAFLRYRVIEPLFPSFSIDLIRSVFWMVIGTPFILGLQYLYFGTQFEHRLTSLIIVTYLIYILVWSKALFHLYKTYFFHNESARLKILIVGNSRNLPEIIDLLNKPSQGMQVIGVLDNAAKKGDIVNGVPFLGKINTVEDILNSKPIDLIVQVSGTENITTLLTLAEHRRIRFMVAPKMFGLVSRSISSVFLGNELLLEPKGTALSGWAQVFKRILDIIFALILGILLSPILLIVALLVKLQDMGSPIFIPQARVDGRSGKEFLMWRFRSLNRGAKEPIPNKNNYHDFPKKLIKNISRDDASWIGHFLRRTHIVDLPELWNVLKGEMGIVGPRPPFKVEYENYDWIDRKRLLIKPGMTGLWQVARHDYTFDEMINTDRFYVEHWSFWLDLKILLKTIGRFISGRV